VDAHPDTILRVRDLTVELPEGAQRLHAVEDISFDLNPDETLCLVGESGSGKSVTGRAILGLLGRTRLQVSGGEIAFKGENLLRASAARMRAIRGAEISMVFQEPMTALNPLMTVGAQVTEILKVHTNLKRQERRTRVLQMFAATALAEPERTYNAFPHQLSGGQRQRAIIAMALILDPQIIIADEPTTALDVTTQAQILKLMRDLQKIRRTGLLFVTHDFGVVAEIADRVAVMQRGRLVETGPTADILNNPQHSYTQALIRAIPKLVPRPARKSSNAQVVLSIRQLKKSYGGRGRNVQAIKGACFELRRGETLGIVGESGSGKSTLARCVVRLIEPDAGEIILDGQNLCRASRRQLRPHRRLIQMVFQDPYSSLNPRVKVGQLVAQGPMVQGRTRAEALQIARHLLNVVGLEEKALDRYPHEFSGGERQRIGIARALALSPAVLVADEPVSALDVSVQSQVLELLAQVRRHFQLAMLFITHDLRVAAQICDRVAVMQSGAIVEEGTTADVFAAPAHPYTRTLLNSVPGRSWERLASGEQCTPAAPED
jgi:peptide/nickel transport system ATP-binding protein